MTFTVQDILNLEVAPALGCTEPVAIALGTASAAAIIGNEPIAMVEIWVDPNIYKNGIAVAIPGTQGHNGLDLAAALGALGGVPEMRLQVLESIDDQIVRRARAMVRDQKVKVNLLQDPVLNEVTVVILDLRQQMTQLRPGNNPIQLKWVPVQLKLS